MITVRSGTAIAIRTPRIGIVINECAHANRRHPQRLRQIDRLVGKHDQVMTTRSLTELDAACATLAAERPDVVAICGGDGTLHRTLTAMIHSYAGRALPPIMILRGGAMNIAAASLGVRGDPVDQLRMLVAARERGGLAACLAGRKNAPKRGLELFAHPLLRVGDHYGFLFGAGVVHNFLQAYYASREPSGVRAASLLARAAGSTLVGGALARRLCRPVHARVVADERIWPADRFVAICAATIEQIGFGFRPFYRCRGRNDGFAVLGIVTTPRELLCELPRIRAGKPIRADKAIDDFACALAIESLEPGELGYTIDGDLYASSGVLRIESGPVLRFVRAVR